MHHIPRQVQTLHPRPDPAILAARFDEATEAHLRAAFGPEGFGEGHFAGRPKQADGDAGAAGFHGVIWMLTWVYLWEYLMRT